MNKITNKWNLNTTKWMEQKIYKEIIAGESKFKMNTCVVNVWNS